MSDENATAEFTAIFRIRSTETSDTRSPLTLHRVPPDGANSVVVFDVTALHGPDASSAIQADNRNLVVLNEVIAAWTKQFSGASNHLIANFEEQLRHPGGTRISVGGEATETACD